MSIKLLFGGHWLDKALQISRLNGVTLMQNDKECTRVCDNRW